MQAGMHSKLSHFSLVLQGFSGFCGDWQYLYRVRKFISRSLSDSKPVKYLPKQALVRFSTFCQLVSNGHAGNGYELMAGIGSVEDFLPEGGDSFNKLKNFADARKDWLFGHFSYDLKNETEDLVSAHPDGIGFPLLYFFRPRFVLLLRDAELQIGFLPGDEQEAEKLAGQITAADEISETGNSCTPLARVSREAYLRRAELIREHIGRGDIYELNYCIEFFAEQALIDPFRVFARLNGLSEAPFSALYRHRDSWLMSASPERFIRKEGRKIISQPIKGTARRGSDPAEDEKNKERLRHDPKERSENIMIADLVRNDLSQVAKRGTVNVEELCGIYSFRQVHQMITTVSAELDDGIHGIDAIRHAFPMGSMTGAPKVRAMQLIEAYEQTKRGLYSGAVGYFTPGGDFDFNVVIRSIQYHAQQKFLSFMAGSAITHQSDTEKEYAECLLKAKAMFEALK
ncbi:MAG: para-aminobenzoate synthetase component I [Bacteroidetes bacterium]|nr:MAG: para-aminobenzoate synthetase component I [Bacteroidota bacterium]